VIGGFGNDTAIVEEGHVLIQCITCSQKWSAKNAIRTKRREKNKTIMVPNMDNQFKHVDVINFII